MDDTSLRTPVLDVHRYSGFKPLRTIWIVFFLISFLLTIEFITLAYVFVFTESHVRCDLYYMIIYAEVSIWAMFFIIRFYINWQHKMYLMTKGYFEFYETASRFIEYPFYICSIWICILLVLTCLYVENAPPPTYFCGTEFFTSPIVAVTAALSFQNVIVIPLFAIYIIVVYEFNKRQLPPDSENGNQYMPSGLRETLASDEAGFRERCEIIDNMLEKQADLIRYYKDANENLNKKLFELTSKAQSIVDA